MNSTIEEIFDIVFEILSYGKLLLVFVLYYLSIKKCFYKGNISKITLFFSSLISNPIVAFIGSMMISATIVRALDLNEKLDYTVYMACSGVLGAILYLVIFLSCSRFMGKILGAYNKELVSFVMMIYSISFMLIITTEERNTENIPFYLYIFNLSVYIVLYIAAFIIYKYVINALSKLTDKPRVIKTKLFMGPVTLFTMFYNSFAVMSLSYDDTTGFALINLFSVIILYLFCWAFYVIIENINSTNEAIEAKDMAASAARMEALIEADLNIAKEIQLSVLPNEFPQENEFELFASMNAAKEVGGDFYDFYMLNDNTFGFIIADVSGKSIPGAMFMMTSKTLIKSLAESGLMPDEVFTLANEKLCESNETEMFVTAWLGYLDLKTGVVRVANAGHNPPVLIRDGRAEFLTFTPGLMLAGMEGIHYKEQTVELEYGDILYLYTDGVTEAMDKNEEQYGEERLKTILSSIERSTDFSKDTKLVENVCRSVAEDIDSFTNGAEQSDDITMLCIRYLGKH